MAEKKKAKKVEASEAHQRLQALRVAFKPPPQLPRRYRRRRRRAGTGV